MRFTYDSYKDLLNMARQYNYDFGSFTNYNYKRCVILRHDIDFSLDKAKIFAEIEYEMGIKATYFFLLATDLYNIASKQGTDIVNEIKGMGHIVGLHFDTAKYGITDNIEELLRKLDKEKAIFNTIFDMRIDCVAMHRPSPFILENDLDFNGLANPYSKLFFKEFKYVSDSRRNWRDDPEEAIKCGKYNCIQILTHPLWYSKEEHSATDVLRDFVCLATRERYNSLNNNIKNFSEFLLHEDINKSKEW